MQPFERAILHLDLDAFFASVECLRNDALRGKPLIIGGTGGRGVVASCSYEARKFGVRSAMPVKMALRLCPDAVVLRGDMDAYSRHSQLITEVIETEAPLFEKASIDEFYLDLSGMDRYIGCWKWARELRAKLFKEAGLPFSMALSVNKLVSKVGAGEAKPNGSRIVENGTEQAFLAPLRIRKLPGIGDATARKLNLMGVQTVQTLSLLPPLLLRREFGRPGLELWKKANAIDESPVVPYRDQQSMSTEDTLLTDTIDPRFLRDKLTGMVTRLAYELRQAGKLTACVTVKIRYTDFNTFTKQQKLPYTAHDTDLLHCAHELLDRLYERRQAIRLIGIKFSNLVCGYPQMELFRDTGEDERLLHAMDQIRAKLGKDAITRSTEQT
ncbi:MAG TPA: DNA polymerase IV [Flavilitoribacter sp.]|nr:DNA polymerase IV [Flavilitoribacter sp.]